MDNETTLNNIFDFKIGDIVEVMSFGTPDKMKVIGHDKPTNQVRLGVIGAQGSSYYTPEKLQQHSQRIVEYNQDQP